MPATFAHPAAILPLRRFTGGWLDFAALVIGSMAPDFGYYVHRFDLATSAHSFAGSALICLPLGLIVFAVFRIVRAPVVYLLPQPHRGALTPIASTPLCPTGAKLCAIALSILLGAWTHCVWDAFTHRGGWAVRRIEVLHQTAFRSGEMELPVYHLLQHGSTIAGTVIVACAYFAWLRLQPNRGASPSDGLRERTRYLLLAAMAAIAVIVGARLATNAAGVFSGYLAVRVFLFRTAVYSIAAFMPLLVVTAVVLHKARRRLSQAIDG
jgi:hypothetical protein